MHRDEIEIQAFYSPLGLKQYRCTHIQVLDIQGESVVFRYREEYRAHTIPVEEFLANYEKLKW